MGKPNVPLLKGEGRRGGGQGAEINQLSKGLINLCVHGSPNPGAGTLSCSRPRIEREGCCARGMARLPRQIQSKR